MLLYPDQQAILRGDAPPEAVLARLTGAVAPGTFFFGGARQEPFTGEVDGYAFTVKRTRRGFLARMTRRGPEAILCGTLQPGGSGTLIRVTARARKIFRVPELLFLLVMSLVTLVAGVAALRGRVRSPELLLVVLVLWVNVPWSRALFRREAARSLASLADALGCTVAPPDRNRLVRS